MFLHFSWRLVLAIVASAAGGSFQFYNLVVINPLQGVVIKWINQTSARRGIQHSELWHTMHWSAIVGMPYLGACIGCAISGALADKLGRQKSLIVSGLSSVLAAILVIITSGAALPEFIFPSRLLFGISLGMASVIVPMYATEASPVRYRGAFGSVHVISGAISDLLGAVIGLPQFLGTKSLWPLAFALPGIPALIMVIILPFCHDSPRYLMIIKKDSQRAYKALMFFVGDANADEAYRNLVQEAENTDWCSTRSSSFIASVIHLFTLRELRMPLLISILVTVGQQLIGAYPIFSYSTEIFEVTGMDPYRAKLGAVGCGITYIVFSCGAACVIDKVGRRKLLIIQYTGSILTLILFTIVQGSLKAIIPTSTSATLAVIIIVAYSGIFAAGVSLAYIIPCEIFTQAYRPQAVSVATFVTFFLAFITTTIYLPFSKVVGVTWSFVPFIVISIMFLLALIYLVPETKNKTVEEITSDLRLGGHHRISQRKAITSSSTELLLNGSLLYGSVEYS